MRLNRVVLIIISGLVLLDAGIGFEVYRLQSPGTATGEVKSVLVEPGMTVAQIATRLEDERLIRSAHWFRLLARYRGVDGRLRIGRYRLETGLTVNTILNRLVSGMGREEQVTIPEGFELRQVAGILRAKAGIDSVQFIALVRDSTVAASLGIDAPTLEGYLFPNTYNIYWQMAPELVIREMAAQFKQVFDERYAQQAQRWGFTLHEAVTLASIIEREARLEEERAIISGVFHNRLWIGQRLESCATIEYLLGVPKPRLFENDLKIPSPYNTYLHEGLPPGPICSPGRASLEAALFPKDVPYLYFVARGDGGHIFSRSNDEHVNAKLRVQRKAT